MRFKNQSMLPGGIRFIDPRVPSMKWLDDHTTLEERIKEVIRFRKQNPVLYPATETSPFDFISVGNEIVTQNCSRIGNDPNWCYDETKSQMNVPMPKVAPIENKCPDCNIPMMPRYCRTCGPKVINGWDCPQCKKSF